MIYLVRNAQGVQKRMQYADAIEQILKSVVEGAQRLYPYPGGLVLINAEAVKFHFTYTGSDAGDYTRVDLQLNGLADLLRAFSREHTAQILQEMLPYTEDQELKSLAHLIFGYRRSKPTAELITLLAAAVAGVFITQQQLANYGVSFIFDGLVQHIRYHTGDKNGVVPFDVHIAARPR